MNTNICFFIATCLKNQLHVNQLIRCLTSIKLYHNDSTIYLINDSDDSFDNFSNIQSMFSNIIVLKTLKKGSADQQVFKFIMNIQNNKFTHFFIMQDSMILNNELKNIDTIKNVKFLWHFTNHILHWDIINEPNTEYNIQNNIKSHTDLIRHHLKKYYTEDEDFLLYALEALNDKKKWCGCSGCCCIITKECIEFLNSKINFVDKFINNTSNRERRMNESLFSLICHYYLPNNNYHDSYDGLQYDGYNNPTLTGTPTGFDNLTYYRKTHYTSKVSFNR